MIIFVRGRIVPEHKNPINRFLIWVYRPVINVVMRAKTLVVLLALAVLAASRLAGSSARLRVHAQPQRGHAHVYADDAAGHLRHQGRRTAADAGQDHSVVSGGGFGLWQGGARCHGDRSGALRNVRDNHQPQAEGRVATGLTVDGLIAEMDKALQFPGVSNAWTMPIKARIDMLSTGIRTPIGVKVIGTDLVEMEKACQADRAGAQGGAGHIVGLCRARHRRLLPRS
jgi:Cu(I)/Ag(I) efflux system membrane protein CusA/SilA